jgi:hypothetical protein
MTRGAPDKDSVSAHRARGWQYVGMRADGPRRPSGGERHDRTGDHHAGRPQPARAAVLAPTPLPLPHAGAVVSVPGRAAPPLAPPPDPTAGQNVASPTRRLAGGRHCRGHAGRLARDRPACEQIWLANPSKRTRSRTVWPGWTGTPGGFGRSRCSLAGAGPAVVVSSSFLPLCHGGRRIVGQPARGRLASSDPQVHHWW